MAIVPALDTDIHDLEGLLTLGSYLWRHELIGQTGRRGGDVMATLVELARQRTALSRDQINHLQRLIGDWGMLADLCFADLLLYTLDQ